MDNLESKKEYSFSFCEWKTYAIVGGLALVFFMAGWLAHRSDGGTTISVRDDSPEYVYTSPLLFTQNTDVDFPELDPLKDALEKERTRAISSGDASRVSIYFRELDGGEWTGADPDGLYAPASLLKVATMIAYLHLGGENPELLTENMYYKYEDDPGQVYKPKTLPSGTYSALGLIQEMIIESDNSAMHLLDARHIPEILDIYKELHMPDPIGSPDNFLSPRLYSRLFRILYNATYISHSYSEGALKLLGLVKFKAGLVAGVPEGTLVAHKFGEHTFVESGIEKYKQLHDCGIIYYPKSPYFLCVMTEGRDYKKLEGVIAEASKTAYEYYDKAQK